MADVFLSYKSVDRGLVELLVGVLRDQNLTIWFDQGLGGDEDYARQIETQLAAARVVIVVWSRSSRESRWVLAEADVAIGANKLLNLSADGTLPPMPFNRLNAQDFSGWTGSASDRRVATLLDDVRRVMQRDDGRAPQDRPLPDDRPAARAWLHIQDSLDARDYRDFLAQHPNSPQAVFAREHLGQLEAFAALRANDAEALHRFLISGPFAALGAHAKAQRDIARAAPAKRAAQDAQAKQQRQARDAYNSARTTGVLMMVVGTACMSFLFWGLFIPVGDSIDAGGVLTVVGVGVVLHLVGYYRWKGARRP